MGLRGLEPPTLRLSVVRSNQLSYKPISVYWRGLWFFSNPAPLVEMRRIELLTPCLQGRCSPSWATPPNASFVFPVLAGLRIFILLNFHFWRYSFFSFSKSKQRISRGVSRKWNFFCLLFFIKKSRCAFQIKQRFAGQTQIDLRIWDFVSNLRSP